MFQFKFRSFFVVFILHFTFSYVIWNDFLVSGMQVRQGKPCLRVEERLFWFSFSLALFQSAPFNCDHCLIDLLWSCLLVSWAHCALRTQPVAPWDFPSALIFNLVHSKCMKIICIYIFFFISTLRYSFELHRNTCIWIVRARVMLMPGALQLKTICWNVFSFFSISVVVFFTCFSSSFVCASLCAQSERKSNKSKSD